MTIILFFFLLKKKQFKGSCMIKICHCSWECVCELAGTQADVIMPILWLCLSVSGPFKCKNSAVDLATNAHTCASTQNIKPLVEDCLTRNTQTADNPHIYFHMHSVQLSGYNLKQLIWWLFPVCIIYTRGFIGYYWFANCADLETPHFPHFSLMKQSAHVMCKQ